MKVIWNTEKLARSLTFNNLRLNDSFRIKGGEAIYIKISVLDAYGSTKLRQAYWMMEIATGKCFPPTKSFVELVDVTINIDLPKPNIYAPGH